MDFIFNLFHYNYSFYLNSFDLNANRQLIRNQRSRTVSDLINELRAYHPI